jgi:hypothetical protein
VRHEHPTRLRRISQFGCSKSGTNNITRLCGQTGEHSDYFGGGDQLVQQVKPLSCCFDSLQGYAGDIGPGAIEARHKAELDGIGACRKDDRDRLL